MLPDTVYVAKAHWILPTILDDRLIILYAHFTDKGAEARRLQKCGPAHTLKEPEPNYKSPPPFPPKPSLATTLRTASPLPLCLQDKQDHGALYYSPLLFVLAA